MSPRKKIIPPPKKIVKRPRRKAEVLRMPEEHEEEIHWLFWVWVALLVMLAISLLVLTIR